MPTELELYLDSLAQGDAITAEDRAALAAILSKNDKIKANAITAHRERLSHADYTRKTQELAQDRNRTVAEVTEINRQLSKALKDLESSKVTATQYRARLESIGEEYGVDVSDILNGTSTQQQTQQQQQAPPAAAVDPKVLERLEAAEKNYRYNPEVSALLLDAQLEYQRTFGSSEGFRASDVLKYARENQLPLMGDPNTGSLGAFERLYKVPEKRHELLVKRITDEAKAKADAEVQTRVDQMLAGRSTGNQTPANAWGAGSKVLSQEFRERNSAVIDARAAANGNGHDAAKHEERPLSQSRSAADQEINGGAAGFAKAFLERRAKGIPHGQAA